MKGNEDNKTHYTVYSVNNAHYITSVLTHCIVSIWLEMRQDNITLTRDDITHIVPQHTLQCCETRTRS